MTWIDSISSDGETMTTRARCAFCTSASKFSWISANTDSDGTNMKAVSWVSPGIRYLSAMSWIWSSMSRRKAWCAALLRSGALGGADGVPGFERKLGVDDQRRRRRSAY